MSAFFDITGPLKHTEQLAALWGEKSAFSINEVAGIILLQLNKLEFAGVTKQDGKSKNMTF